VCTWVQLLGAIFRVVACLSRFARRGLSRARACTPPDHAHAARSVNARWLWERAPAAVQGDEDMGKLWEVAKILWNSDMAAAYTQLASAGNGKLWQTWRCRDNLFF
jgi:hypothetical protein